jgi:hypothetical protein
VIDGSNNPTLNLLRGFTYTFNINASGHPFYIKTSQTTGTGNQYTSGVTGNGTQSGTLTFAVPYNAPSTLYYICQYHSAMKGTISISDVGPTGAQGATGSTGAQGAQGATGSTGAQGAQGATGSGGSTGAQGAQGHQGNTGSTGAQGATSAQGAQGAVGASGSAGNTGAQGAQGHQGNTGGGGSTGAQGAAGAQGATGSGGSTGAQGAQGHQGQSGTNAGQGAQGAAGAQGATGSGGSTGAQGAAGAQGQSGTNAGQGAQGATGATGAQGATGSTGAQGGTSTYAVPAGGIIIWSGASNAIPSGWYLCDGNNGTPNLKDRFVIGAGNSYAVDATGGSKDATLVSHSHTINNHTHTFSGSGSSSHSHNIFSTDIDDHNDSARRIANDRNDRTGYYPSNRDISTDSTTVSISVSGTTGNPSDRGTNTQGSSATNANLPPYYALCYIMKS